MNRDEIRQDIKNSVFNHVISIRDSLQNLINETTEVLFDDFNNHISDEVIDEAINYVCYAIRKKDKEFLEQHGIESLSGSLLELYENEIINKANASLVAENRQLKALINTQREELKKFHAHYFGGKS